MNISAQLRTLAALVVGLCFVLSAFSAPIRGRVYIVRDLEIAIEKDYLLGVEFAVNQKNEDKYVAVFDAIPIVWDAYLKHQIPDTAVIEEVSIEQVPVVGLFEIVKYKPELYSDVLPALISNSSPKEVAQNLSVDLFRTLTPEARNKISPENLAELAKLYGQ